VFVTKRLISYYNVLLYPEVTAMICRVPFLWLILSPLLF
jgi:hypothetical protein